MSYVSTSVCPLFQLTAGSSGHSSSLHHATSIGCLMVLSVAVWCFDWLWSSQMQILFVRWKALIDLPLICHLHLQVQCFPSQQTVCLAYLCSVLFLILSSYLLPSAGFRSFGLMWGAQMLPRSIRKCGVSSCCLHQ